MGFSTASRTRTAAARLQAIASDTGGKYYPLNDSSQLQSVMNNIGAAIACQQPPRTFTDQLAQGKSKSHAVTVRSGVKSLQIALSWSSPLDTFTISKLRIVRHGKTVAVAAKARKLKVKVTKSQTFTVLKVSRLVKGKLQFRVTAKTIGSGAPKVTLVTQVSPRKKEGPRAAPRSSPP